jgi:hypothetical protein
MPPPLPPIVNEGRMIAGKPMPGLNLQRLFQAVRHRGAGRTEADLGHRLLELLAVLGLVDGLLGSADHFDAVLFQHAVLGEVERAIERGLPAHGRQQGIRPFLGDDGSRPSAR